MSKGLGLCIAASALAVLGAGACGGPQQPAPRSAAATAPGAGGAPTLAKATSSGLPEGPPITLLPASTARPLQLSAISVTSVDRLLQSGAALVGNAVPLPFDPAGLRDLLLGQAGLSPDVAANLDLAGPSGAAVVALGAPGQTGLVMAVAARGAVEAERVIAALGKPIGKRGGALLVDNGSGGRGWVLRSGNVVVLSDEVEALSRGAMLALEARHPAPDDVTAVLYPEAIARANGTDVKSALSATLEALRAVQQARGAGAAPGAGGDYSMETAGEMLSLLADADTVDLGLAVDATRGLVLRVRLHARPGSRLASVAQAVLPFELDPAVLAGGGVPAAIGASSYGPFMRGLLARQRERLQAAVVAKEKGAGSALAFFDAMMAALAGQTSAGCGFSREAPHLSAEIIYPLKDAASAAKLAAALGRLDRQAAVSLWQAQFGAAQMFDWTVKKEAVGKLKALHYTLTVRKGASVDPEVTQKLFGRGIDTYVAVTGTRLVATIGRDAKSRLTALAALKPGAPAGVLADALAAAKGRDGFLYLDFAPLLGLLGTYAQDPRAALLSQGSVATAIPLYATAGGDGAGRVWSLDLTLPPAAFVGAGAIIQRMSLVPGTGGGK